MSERIQKLLATAGVASRRAIETMIAEGRVTVNGRPAEAGQKIDHHDHVRIDSRLISLTRKQQEPARVLLYRKRVGELVTRDDPEGRKTVFRKLPELVAGRWIAIGRLDINTSGLLLLTNDGELARRLMHPSFEMRREYAVRVLGAIDDAMLARLRNGVTLEDGFAKFETIVAGSHEAEADGSANSWCTVTVKQGRNRVVRRLFESQNLQVSRLMRVSYGPVALGRGIKSGSFREASADELQALLSAVGMTSAKPARASAKTSEARRKPSPVEAPIAPTRPPQRRSPRAAAEAQRKREFFERDDMPAKPGTKPGAATRKPSAKDRKRSSEAKSQASTTGRKPGLGSGASKKSAANFATPRAHDTPASRAKAKDGAAKSPASPGRGKPPGSRRGRS